MSTKPAQLPIWATDGTNNTAPSLAQKQSGWTPGQDGVSSYDNWVKELIYEWIVYFNDGDFDGDFHVTGDATFDQDLIANTIHASSNISSDASIYALGSLNAPAIYRSGNQTYRIPRNRWFDVSTGALLPYTKTGSYPTENTKRTISSGGRAAIYIEGLPGGAQVNQVSLQIASSSAAYTFSMTRQGLPTATTVSGVASHGTPSGGDLRFDTFPAVYEFSAGGCMMLLLEASGGADIDVGDVVVRYTEPHP